jgi:hypothetical protein
MICYDLRGDKQTFREEYGTLDVKLIFANSLPENNKLLVYSVGVHQYFVFDDSGNLVPRIEKITF